jgi:hypothetical protein
LLLPWLPWIFVDDVNAIFLIIDFALIISPMDLNGF